MKNTEAPRLSLKRLLVMHQGALGDFIATFPVLAILRRFYAGIDGLCRNAFGPLAQHLGLIDTFQAVESARFSSLYTDAPDSRAIAWFSACGRVLLFSFSDELAQCVRTVTQRRVYRIPPWPREGPCMPVTRFLVHHLVSSGFFSAEEKKRFGRRLAQMSRRRVDDAFSTQILLGPGAGSISKRWPLVAFLALADRLSEKHFKPIFLLGPLEADIERQLTTPGHCPYPVFKTENLSNLADFLKTVGGYIGNDSAVGHLAAFLGRPTVIVFGPSNPECWAPFGPAVGIVQAEMDCRPCGLEKSAGCDHRACLRSIAPERVMDVFVEVYDRCKNFNH